MASEGDIILPLMGTDGKVIAFQVAKVPSEGDVTIPALGTDGKVVSLKVIPLTSDGKQGFGVVGIDGIVTPVTSGGNLIWGMRSEDFLFVDSDDDILNVGWLNGTKLDKIGLNEGFEMTTPSTRVEDIIQVNGILYVCGGMESKRDASGFYSRVAMYDPAIGEWTILDGTDIASNAVTRDMTEFQGNMIVVGNFSNANSVFETNSLAGFNGTNWISYGADGGSGTLGTSVISVAAFDDDLYAEANAIGVRRWNGGSWDQLPGNPSWRELEGGENFLYGARFDNRVFTYDGTAVNEITQGAANSAIRGMTEFQGDLIICGGFVTISGGTISANRVARYNHDTATWSAMGLGLGSNVNDVHVDNGILYAGGGFTTNGDGDDVQSIAQWNPSSEKWVSAANTSNLNSGNVSRFFSSDINLTGGQ